MVQRPRSSVRIARIFGIIAAAMLGCGHPPASTPGSATTVGPGLDVATTFPALTMAPPARELDVVGPFLVLQGYASWVRSPAPPLQGWVFDAKTGAPISTLAPVGPLNMEVTTSGPGLFLRATGDVLVGMSKGVLFAIDPATGRPRWQTTVDERLPHERTWPAATAALAGTIFVVLQELHAKSDGKYGLDGSLEVLALDASSGAVRWRAPVGAFDILERSALGLFVTDRAVVVRRGHELVGLVDGKTAWTPSIRPVAPDSPFALVRGDRSTLVAIEKGFFSTIDPASGTRGPKHADSVGYDATTVLDAGVLFAWSHAGQSTKLVATRAADAKRLWESSPLRDTAPNRQPPMPAPDAVYGCISNALRMFDRATGATTYTNNLGGCAHVGVTRDSSTVVVTTGTEGRPTSFTRVAASPPPRRVHVTGTVLLECLPQAGIPVWIDDTPATTDSSGRFDLEVTSRGLVSIDATVKGQMLAVDGRTLTLEASAFRNLTPAADGSVRADLDLHMRTNCGGDYEPLACKPVKTACPP